MAKVIGVRRATPRRWACSLAALSLLSLAVQAVQKADLGGDSTVATINHSLSLLQRLQELLHNGNASDTTLRVRTTGSDEIKVFHTHQLLLSLQSEIFESLLHNQTMLTLHEPPDSAALFEKFIRGVKFLEMLKPWPKKKHPLFLEKQSF